MNKMEKAALIGSVLLAVAAFALVALVVFQPADVAPAADNTRAMGYGGAVSGALVDRLVAPDGSPNPAVQVGNDGTATFYGPLVVDGDTASFASMDAVSITVSNGGWFFLPNGQILGGYVGNTIDSSAVGAVILNGGSSGDLQTILDGGTRSTIIAGDENSIDAQNGFIGAGLNNIIASGGADSGIGAGSANSIDTIRSFIGGGRLNVIDGSGSLGFGFIGGGQQNTIYAEGGGAYATIAGGYGAYTRSYGEMAHAAGYFATAGDAQAAEYVVRRSVTHSSTAWSSLLADGSTATLIPLVYTDTVATLDILVSGESVGGAKAFSYHILAFVENDGGTVAILASTVTTVYEDDSDFDCQLAADDPNNGILVQVKDATSGSDVVRWVATIRSAEVTFP